MSVNATYCSCRRCTGDDLPDEPDEPEEAEEPAWVVWFETSETVRAANADEAKEKALEAFQTRLEGGLEAKDFGSFCHEEAEEP